MELGELSDRAAIESLLHRFAAGIDRCDWAAYRSVFTDEIDLDYSSYRAGSVGRWRADDWVDRAKPLFHGLDATQHALSNVSITFDGPDQAQVVAYLRADHVLRIDGRDEVYTLSGYYDDRVVRTADGWRIMGKRLVVRWREGDATIMETAVERGRGRAEPERGRT